MLIVHFILKIEGVRAGLPDCHPFVRYVGNRHCRPDMDSKFAENITWRHTTPLAIKIIGYFPSYTPCRNKDFYHNSYFVMIFNIYEQHKL